MTNAISLQELLAETTKQGDCLIWTKAKGANGYGYIRNDRKIIAVHKAVAEIKYGQIPNGHVVMHSCDNRACINPDHLLIGTQKDNLHDMWAKNRAHNGVLSPEQIKNIKERFQPRHPQNGARALAREFGVTHQAISKVVRGKSWNR